MTPSKRAAAVVYGTPPDDQFLESLENRIAAAISEAVAAERERAARLAESHVVNWSRLVEARSICADIAARIRSGG